MIIKLYAFPSKARHVVVVVGIPGALTPPDA